MSDTVSLDLMLRQLLAMLFLPPLNALLLLSGAWLLRHRWTRSARAATLTALLLIYLQSTPWLASQLNESLSPYPPATLAQVRQSEAIVILGAGKRPAREYAANVPTGDALARLRYGVWLSRQSGVPILLSGGAPIPGEAEALVMARVLRQEYGLTPRWLEAASNTTDDNARLSAQILRQHKVGRITLVTQAWHMPRAMAAFATTGLQVLPAPTGFVEYEGVALHKWLPSGRAMQEVHQAEREWLGRGFYQLREIIRSMTR